MILLSRAFEDEAKARLGVVECAKHELLQPFSVLHDKEGECRRRPAAALVFTEATSFITQLVSSVGCRRVCGPVQVHGAADGQRLSQNHQRTLPSRAVPVGARGAGSTAQGSVADFSALTATLSTGFTEYRLNLL